MHEDHTVNFRIAVLGGTGKSGKYIVDELIRNGTRIKLLVRTAEKAPEKHPLIEVVMGSARNHANIQRLLSGCNAVISALGPSGGETDICSVALRHVNTVMKQLNIKRYIEIAGLGLMVPGDHRGLRSRLIAWGIKTFSPATVKDRTLTYEILSSGSLEWTIVRCPTIELTNDRRNLKVNLEDSPGFKVSAADLGAFIRSQLTSNEYIRKCPFVAS
ncbi:MAG TPA: NAD(P)H-binding protein [Bacteroidales bacterium]|nr:NAD(P)H-binding protein [Bacteroidales bacterium]